MSVAAIIELRSAFESNHVLKLGIFTNAAFVFSGESENILYDIVKKRLLFQYPEINNCDQGSHGIPAGKIMDGKRKMHR